MTAAKYAAVIGVVLAAGGCCDKAHADTLSKSKAASVTRDFGRWEMRQGDLSEFRVENCERSSPRRVRCELYLHLLVDDPLSEGWPWYHVRVTRRDDHICARSDEFERRPKEYDCRGGHGDAS